MPPARYRDIYQSLRHDIQSGRYPLQTLLPTEEALAERFACSRNTVRRAIAMLISEGYVQTVQGKGSVVIYSPLQASYITDTRLETFSELAARTGATPASRCLTLKHVVCDEGLARQSGYTPGEDLWYLEVVRSLDGKALIRARGWLRACIVPHITREIAEHSIYRYLEEELGLQIVTSKRLITAERASDRDLEVLDLDGLDFVTVQTSWSYDADGVMFEFSRAHHHPDYFAFSNVATREGTGFQKL